jgi:hypothetical protein
VGVSPKVGVGPGVPLYDQEEEDEEEAEEEEEEEMGRSVWCTCSSDRAEWLIARTADTIV